MRLPAYKTKIVCTVGPASRSEAVLERLMLQGMNVARLNFAHGTLQGHREDIRSIRAVAARLQRHCLIMADLPGPKIRIGKLLYEPLILEKGQEGVDAFGVSFGKGADDILKVKAFAQKRGQSVYVVAKIERAEAIDNFDAILSAADAIMIARGDLGVQIPLTTNCNRRIIWN